VEASVKLLEMVFPSAPHPAAERDFCEPRGPRSGQAYAREHAEIFAPIRALFAQVREISTAITHEVGAFG
jgi:phosphoenolpyruvate carboxylase